MTEEDIRDRQGRSANKYETNALLAFISICTMLALLTYLSINNI